MNACSTLLNTPLTGRDEPKQCASSLAAMASGCLPEWRLPCTPMGRESKRMLSPNPHLSLHRGPADAATVAATPRRGDGYLVSRLTIGAFQTLRPLRPFRHMRGGRRGEAFAIDVVVTSRMRQSRVPPRSGP